jgi:Ca2+-binding RTX toxin-like protein
MPSVNQYLIYAELALASYGAGLLLPGPKTDRYRAAGMSAPQAEAFDRQWAVLDQVDLGNGFSAALFQRVDSNGIPTGEKVLAIRGTDNAWGLDAVANAQVALLGTAVGMPQYQALEAFYQQLVTTGKLGSSEQISVTGHSLGGFLTQAFAAEYSSVVSAAYTYNAPGFSVGPGVSNIGTQLLEFFGIASASIPNGKIFNVRAVEGASAIAGLGQMIGSVQPINIEGGSAVQNHSIKTLADVLSLQAALATLDPAVSASKANTLVQVASNQHGDTLESLLDALRAVFIGSASNDVNETPTGDRDRFYSNLYSLQNDSGFKALTGRVALVQAHGGFATLAQGNTQAALPYRYALLELLPFAVVADSEAANQTLYSPYVQRLSLHDESTGQGELSGQWLSDRAAMLGALVLRNQQDVADEVAGGSGLKPVQYADVASGLQFQIGLNNQLGDKPQVRFGGDLAETVNGKALADHLYGGGGNDLVNGFSGADYLEGNAGSDTLDGGDGFDTLVGGTGADVLIGGAGIDRLRGGLGADSYNFNAGWGTDTIEDIDGQGSITVAGIGQLTGAGALKLADGVWQSPDKQVTYALDDASKLLLITTRGTTDSIVIKNWTPTNNLGITLASDRTFPTTNASLIGDFQKLVSNGFYERADRNYVCAGAQVNAQDLISGSYLNQRRSDMSIQQLSDQAQHARASYAALSAEMPANDLEAALQASNDGLPLVGAACLASGTLARRRPRVLNGPPCGWRRSPFCASPVPTNGSTPPKPPSTGSR